MRVGLALSVLMLVLPGTSASNGTAEKEEEDKERKCKEGMIIPLWQPQDNLSTGDKAARAIIYFSGLCFMFLGISIIADRFMASIEVITSKEREVTIRTPSGETTVMHVRIWNETVSNLTLMALGSSAPEIMLSVIEIIGNKFGSWYHCWQCGFQSVCDH